MKLTDEQIEANLQDSNGWELTSETWIKKAYTFPSFTKTMQFINELADIAEKRQHHPHMTIDHSNVTIQLSTLDQGGLTQLDFESAHAYDLTYEKYHR
ncbi:4a-hydroxytetrahydrobiopterin dehydratase [Texcoconibacillus texcoconensis]|uniref:4a-hydroxytetrahydrobiopterin dehydratase n=1 Tax=Texcoconibacillus texcoconensis TaxID=1095777 RepID=A0A840QS74_9BACI|nr:4a-hydroxytetrahydrobiopterin dehydratase [Texcoconibacillus texcoconensis]MBB5174352.1 4a-hydroxytetrahydrobiopterin dehydratase [Texcoconibacillus texcoconensis]